MDGRKASRIGLATALLAGIYWGTGALAMSFGEPIAYAYKAPLWPPSGIALAMVLYLGSAIWPGITIGSLLIGLFSGAALPLHIALAVAASNTIMVLLAAFLYRRVVQPPAYLGSLPSIVSYIVLAGLLSTLVGAVIGTTLFSVFGIIAPTDFLYVTWAWWAGDVLSLLVLTPWILAWREAPQLTESSAVMTGFGASLLVLFIASGLVFDSWIPLGIYSYPLSYLLVLIIGWVCLRYGFFAATTSVVLVVSMAIWGTLRGFGPFIRETPFETSILLQSFMSILSLTALLFTAVIIGYRRKEQVITRLHSEQIKHLKQIDTMKDQFLSILSHELRTPLNAMTGFGSILSDEVAGPLNEKQHEYLKKMLAGADTLLALVDDLLDMSRIEAGKFTVAPQPVCIDEIINRVVGNLAPLARKNQVETINQAATDLPAIDADPQRISQVLTNLITNAIKFTPPGGHITVRARLDAETQELRCEVEDTGAGIDAQDIPKLFQRFAQLDMTSTRKVGGTGLGLSISKAIIKAHGGRIGAHSEGLGKGSVFWFTLPLFPPSRPPDEEGA